MSGRETVEALIATLNAGDVDSMDAVFHEDAVMDWPQSGERVVGGENRRGVYRAFPRLPKITPRRLIGEGDLWVAEADLDYGDGGHGKTPLRYAARSVAGSRTPPSATSSRGAATHAPSPWRC